MTRTAQNDHDTAKYSALVTGCVNFFFRRRWSGRFFMSAMAANKLCQFFGIEPDTSTLLWTVFSVESSGFWLSKAFGVSELATELFFAAVVAIGAHVLSPADELRQARAQR